MGVGTPMGVKLCKITRYVVLKVIALISDRDTLYLFDLDQPQLLQINFVKFAPIPYWIVCDLVL